MPAIPLNSCFLYGLLTVLGWAAFECSHWVKRAKALINAAIQIVKQIKLVVACLRLIECLVNANSHCPICLSLLNFLPPHLINDFFNSIYYLPYRMVWVPQSLPFHACYSRIFLPPFSTLNCYHWENFSLRRNHWMKGTCRSDYQMPYWSSWDVLFFSVRIGWSLCSHFTWESAWFLLNQKRNHIRSRPNKLQFPTSVCHLISAISFLAHRWLQDQIHPKANRTSETNTAFKNGNWPIKYFSAFINLNGFWSDFHQPSLFNEFHNADIIKLSHPC